MKNYIKLFEDFKSDKEITRLCNKYKITSYVINDDYSIDVNGNVNLVKQDLNEIPLNFRNVTGSFNVSDNKLTSLKGAPIKCGKFECVGNELTSLEFCPQEVDGDFNCFINKLSTLEFSPIKINGCYNACYNSLTTLKGCPEEINGFFNISNNSLTNIDYFPKYIKHYFNISINSLTTLKGLPESFNGNIDCSNNKLTNLEYSPINIGGNFRCNSNLITSLKGSASNIKGDFIFNKNKINSFDGCPEKVNTFNSNDNPIYSFENFFNLVSDPNNITLNSELELLYNTFDRNYELIDAFNDYNIIKGPIDFNSKPRLKLSNLNKFLTDFNYTNISENKVDLIKIYYDIK